MARYPRKYSKDMGHLTTIRLPLDMRKKAEEAAEKLGISFSDFVRQSINRNLYVSSAIEQELIKQTADQTIGRVRDN